MEMAEYAILKPVHRSILKVEYFCENLHLILKTRINKHKKLLGVIEAKLYFLPQKADTKNPDFIRRSSEVFFTFTFRGKRPEDKNEPVKNLVRKFLQQAYLKK